MTDTQDHGARMESDQWNFPNIIFHHDVKNDHRKFVNVTKGDKLMLDHATFHNFQGYIAQACNLLGVETRRCLVTTTGLGKCYLSIRAHSF